MNSPEIIIVTSVCFVLPVAALLTAYHFRRLTSQERIHAIEKGVSIPFETLDPRERAARTRRWGIVLVALGIGFALALVIVAIGGNERDAYSAVGFGLIPALIGAGLLIEYRLRSKELDAAGPKP